MWRKFFGNAMRQLFFGGLLLMSIFSVAEAKELPEIVWSRDIYTMTIADDYHHAERRRGYQLLNAGTAAEQKANREIIAKAIADKLTEQKDKLPFKLKMTLDVGDLSERNFELSDSAMSEPIALVPIVVTDYSIDKTYVINNQVYQVHNRFGDRHCFLRRRRRERRVDYPKQYSVAFLRINSAEQCNQRHDREKSSGACQNLCELYGGYD
ncbi:MAG: hypothetical protein IKG61_02895 [Selenomonadaceae bacterium]|nr:hypothetical protein [Selenomonadaceae bacterium]